MKAHYTQRFDNEGFTVKSGEIHRVACCDCNLVHDLVLVSEDGKPVGVAVRRNNRSTSQRRRSKAAHNIQPPKGEA